MTMASSGSCVTSRIGPANVARWRRSSVRTSSRVRASRAESGSSSRSRPGSAARARARATRCAWPPESCAGLRDARAVRSSCCEVVVGVPAGVAAAGTPRSGRERDVVADSEVREEPVVLEHQPDRAPLGRHERPGGCVVEDRRTQPDAARRDRGQPRQRAQQGRLAGAVGAEHSQHFPRRDREADVEGERAAADNSRHLQGHAAAPVLSHLSRSATRTAIETASRTKERAMAASGSRSRAR